MKIWIIAGFAWVALIGAADFSTVRAADPASSTTDQEKRTESSPQTPDQKKLPQDDRAFDKGNNNVTGDAVTGDQGSGSRELGAGNTVQKLASVEVTHVDQANGTIEIKKKEGGRETIKLDEGVQAQLEKIQKGDTVDIELVDRNGEKFAKSLTKAG